MAAPAYLQRYWKATKRPVWGSPEFVRINALPRRVPVEPPAGWEDKFRRRPGPTLLPAQRIALYELEQQRGLLGALGVGAGKSWISILAASVLRVSNPVILVPSALVAQTGRILNALDQDWLVVRPTIVGYEFLSSKRQWDLLERWQPDLIVADEAHRLKNPKAACTKRVAGYLRKSGALFVPLSGTMTDKSPHDWEHLGYWSLGDGCPAPHDWKTREEWHFALGDLGPGMENTPPGVLRGWAVESDDPIRDGYAKRVLETPGVVATSEFSCKASILVTRRQITPPAQITKALEDLRRLWRRPDGVDLSSALDFYRTARTLSLGFYQRWTKTPPPEWLDARQAWCSERARWLSTHSGSNGIDSPARYELAVQQGRVKSTMYQRWVELEPAFTPETETVWLSNFLVEDAAEWAKGEPGIVWAKHPDWGRAVAAASGMPYYGSQEENGDAVLDELPGERSIILSHGAHYQGRNLQGWRRMLWPGHSSQSQRWEQTLGRCHRTGQRADDIECAIYLHTPELREQLDAALVNARYCKSAFRQPQRLLAARLLVDLIP